MKKAIVIGAGVAGMASAIRLAVKGYAVSIFEANAYPGGKLTAWSEAGFRFDAGPSLFTMPHYVDELFVLAGKNPRAYFNYKQLDPVCRYFYADGTRLSAWADEERFAQEVAEKTNDTAQSVHRFFMKSKKIYNITHHVFLERSLHKLGTYLNLKTFKSILQLYGIDALRKMNAANEHYFTDPRMQQFFNRYATYNGSNPYQAPATLNVIPHLEHHFGAWLPDGGMYSITTSLVRLAEELGVKFHYNSAVSDIITENKSAKGIKVNDKIYLADAIVSNMDIYFTYTQLLKDQIPPHRILKQERSSSALIFYWGIKREFEELHLHNIFFGSDYKAEFDHIFIDKDISSDPTVYLNISSKHVNGDAPAGCENWFVMINVPNNSGQDWDDLIVKARMNIISKLSKALGCNIEELIVNEQVLDPRSIERKTSSYQGSLYGTSSNSRLAAFMRHANFSSNINNLYFCGGSVHPGGGIPLALLSAKIISELIN